MEKVVFTKDSLDNNNALSYIQETQSKEDVQIFPWDMQSQVDHAGTSPIPEGMNRQNIAGKEMMHVK